MKKAKPFAKAKDVSPLSPSSSPHAVIDRWFDGFFFALTAGVALLALLLWFSGQWRLGTLGSSWVPMAPSTALLLLALASAAWLGQRRPDSATAHRFGFAVGLGVLAMSLLIGSQFVFRFQLPPAPWLIRTSETVGQIPVGHMSPLTATVFLLASLACLLELPLGLHRRASRQAAAVLALVVLFISGGVALSYVLQEPLMYGGTLIPMAATTAVAFVFVGLGLVLTAGADTWPLGLFVPSASVAPPTRQVTGELLVLFLLFATAISVTGWVYFKRQQAEAHRTAQETLSAIADLKVGQIADWMKDQRDAAEIIFKSRMVWNEIQHVLIEPNDAAKNDKLLEWMTTFQQDYSYSEVILFDTRGVARLTVPTDSYRLQALCIDKHVQVALHAREVVFEDLYHCHSDQSISLSFLIPIGIKSQESQSADGVLLLNVDPQRFLYPLIQSWPTPSLTAETLLVRREGHEVVFLNNLRHCTNTALTLRLPMDPKLRLPAAIAAQEEKDVVEGVDYRGIPVLAALRKIPGTHWFMVAKWLLQNKTVHE